MKIFVFDIDNTLILHTNKKTDFYQKSDSKISALISNIKVDNVYIYTNGTYGHGEKVHKSLNIPKTKKIFGLIQEKFLILFGQEQLNLNILNCLQK